jgi:hypothetical protein
MRRKAVIKLVAGLWCAALLLGACSQMGGGKADLGPTEQARAQQLFETLSGAQKSGRWEDAAAAASALVNQYPRFARMDETLFLAGQAADARGRFAEAATYYDKLSTGYPLSARRPAALRASAADFAGSMTREARRGSNSCRRRWTRPLATRRRGACATSSTNSWAEGDLDALCKTPDRRSPAARSISRRWRTPPATTTVPDLVAVRDALPAAAGNARRLLGPRPSLPATAGTDIACATDRGAIAAADWKPGALRPVVRQGAKLAVDKFGQSVRAVSQSRTPAAAPSTPWLRSVTVGRTEPSRSSATYSRCNIAGAIEANAWRT